MSHIFGKPLVPYHETHKAKKPEGPRERFEKLRNEPLRVFIRLLPCILAGMVDRFGVPHVCAGQVVACHLKTKGSKGGDDDNLFPGCSGINGCHAEQEGQTKEFEYKWCHPNGGLPTKLKAICKKLTARFYGEKKHGKRPT